MEPAASDGPLTECVQAHCKNAHSRVSHETRLREIVEASEMQGLLNEVRPQIRRVDTQRCGNLHAHDYDDHDHDDDRGA